MIVRWINTSPREIPGRFFVECNREEAEDHLVPKLSADALKHFRRQQRELHADNRTYAQCAFCIDARGQVIGVRKPWYPFANLWNGHSPWRQIEPIEADSLEDAIAKLAHHADADNTRRIKPTEAPTIQKAARRDDSEQRP